MEYFYAFQKWLYDTPLYQDILRELPVPLNNIYFDSLMLLGLDAYLVYRIIEAVRIVCYRRRFRRKQEGEHRQQLEREKEMMYQELQVQQKEEKLGRFMDYMGLLFASCMRNADDYENYDSQENYNSSEYSSKKIGRKNFFLRKKDSLQIGQREDLSNSSDYDVVMDAFVYDVEQEHAISKRQEAEMEQLHSNISALDDELCVRVAEETTEMVTDMSEDPILEKRKARARKEAEKERKRAEKLLKKKQRGEGHGGFGKKSKRGG